jgi:6-phosphogluconate dehydrogenase
VATHTPMKIGMRDGHTRVVYHINADAFAKNDGATAASSVADLIGRLSQPRAVWVMVPADKPR